MTTKISPKQAKGLHPINAVIWILFCAIGGYALYPDMVKMLIWAIALFWAYSEMNNTEKQINERNEGSAAPVPLGR